MVKVNKNFKLGFTLIEMIVSLGVFSVVVTTAVGALLVIISTNQQLQAEQSVMTNLAFALDTMTREIRTGFNYVCASANNVSANPVAGLVNGLLPVLAPPPRVFDETLNKHEIVGERTRDCASGRGGDALQGVSFYEGGNSLTGSAATRIMYFYDETDPLNKTIKRRVGDNDAQSIVSSGLFIKDAQFFVTGSTPSNGGTDTEQPTVTVYIEAQEKNDPSAKIYHLQTTVTQRVLDI